MATSFEEIYCLNSVIKIDQRLNDKPSYELYNLYWKYLQFSISMFQYDCRKNLLDLVPFSLTNYTFIGDGVNNIFELDPVPEGGELIAKYYKLLAENKDLIHSEDGKQILASLMGISRDLKFYVSTQLTCGETSRVINDFIYDEINHTITLTNYTPAIGENIEIIAYNIGEFNCDLDFDEKRILAEGMNLPYYQEQMANSKILNFATYGGSIKMHSQAEQEKVVAASYQIAKRELEGDISRYSYRTAPIGVPGLGARNVCLNQLRRKIEPLV